MQYSISSLLLICQLASAQSDVPSVNDVIVKVRDAELLYFNLDVKYTMRTIPLRDNLFGPPDQAIKESKIVFHSVRQSGKTRLTSQQQGKRLDGKAFSSNQDMGFDGEFSRVKRGGVFNKHTGNKEFEDLFRPHSFAIRGLFAPLHIWLGGGDAMRSHPGSHFGWSEAEVISKVVSRENINGLSCIKLVCDAQYIDKGKGKMPLGRLDLWLAEDRCMLPIKFNYYNAKKPLVPSTESQFTDLFEVTTGIWLPRKIELIQYDFFESKPNALVADHKVVHEVISADPDPKYPDSFFRDIVPNANMAVYEVSDGQISKSQVGHQYLYDIQQESKKRPYLLWGITIFLLMTTLALFMYFRQRRQRMAHEI